MELSTMNVTLRPPLRNLKLSATIAINQKSNALIAAGRTVHKFGLGPVSYTHLTLPTIA